MFILNTWNRMKALPGGKWVFSRFVGQFAPYSGSIGACVRELAPGNTKVTLRERRAVRNHLNSIHAVALMNLAELSSGLAMISGLPDTVQGIVTAFHIEYFKKARGTITAIGQCDIPPAITERIEAKSHVKIYNTEKQLLCQATATWTLGPKKV